MAAHVTFRGPAPRRRVLCPCGLSAWHAAARWSGRGPAGGRRWPAVAVLAAVLLLAGLPAGGPAIAGALLRPAGEGGGPAAVLLPLQPVADLPAALSAQLPRVSAGWVSGWSVALVPPRLAMKSAARAALPPALRPPEGNPGWPDNATVRVVLPVAVAGDRLRLRIANPYGSAALSVGAATLAPGGDAARPGPGSLRRVTFGGRRTIVVPPGATVLSDPVRLAVAADGRVVVSLYFSGPVPRPAAAHAAPLGGLMVAGNAAASPALPNGDAVSEVWFLAGLDVGGSRAAGTLAVIGDSLSDGGPDRWSWWLGRRLAAAGRPLGIANQAVAGNRLLSAAPAAAPASGEAALARLPRDVLALPGLSDLIVLEGSNDIGLAPDGETRPEAVIAAYRQIIAQARGRGVRVFLGTLPPFGAARYPGYFSPAKNRVRQAVNAWIRTAGEADGVIDFDAALRDPMRPHLLKAAFDAGDGLHINAAGQRAMAAAVPLSLLR